MSLLIQVLEKIGVAAPETATEKSLLDTYQNMAALAAAYRCHRRSNEPAVWGKSLEYAHEAERYGAAVVVFRGEKLNPRHPFFGVVKMTDTQNKLGCQ